MSRYLHGAETVETVSGPVPIEEVPSSIIAVFGTSELAATKNMYRTIKLDEAEALYGEGTILDTLRRIHTYYTPFATVIGIPLGKPGEFVPAKADKQPHGVTMGSSIATAYLDQPGFTLPAISNPNGLELTYATDTPTVATVDAKTGKVALVKEGAAVVTITIKADATHEGGELKCALTVEKALPADAGKTASTAALPFSEGTLVLGSTLRLSVTNSQGLPVTWVSSAPDVASVDATGVVTALTEGSAQIAADITGDSTYARVVLTCELTVAKPADKLLASFIDALPLLTKSRTRFGFNPKICLAPGIMHKPGASGAVLPIARKLRQVWLADVPEQTATPEEAREAKQKMSDERIFCMWPRPKVLNARGSTVVDWAAPSWAGLIAQVDKNLAGIQGGSGYWCSPSNLKLGDVVGVEHELDFIINEPDTQVNYLNQNGIATIINYGGLMAWGNRSTSYPDKTDPMTLLAWRRTADVIEESIEYFVMQFIDRPMFTRPDSLATTLLGRVQDSVNDYLRSLVGTAIVDGKCWIDIKANPLAELSKGVIRFKYRFVPPMVTEHIVLDAEIYVQGLEDAFKKLIGG